MRPKNYSQNGKNKSSGNDTVGIVLIIVFSFLLLCSATGSLILGDIGLVIKNLSLGLLGYFSYPIFLYCIIRGIFILQNKSLSVRLRNVISLIVIFFCAGMIIHLATTSSYLSDFGGYMNKVFHSATVGGVFMGLFVYLFASALSSVGAYILLGCIIMVLLLVVAGFFDNGVSFNKSKKRKKTADSVSNSLRGGTSFVGNGSDLFIESIIPPQSGMAVPGSFDDLPDETERYMDRPSYAPGEESYSPEIQKMRRQQDERFDEIYRKSRAHQILFENRDPDEEKKSESARQSVDNGSPSYSRRRSESSSGGWDDLIAMPPPKDIKSRFVSGSIINGESAGPVKRAESRYGYDSATERDYGNAYGKQDDNIFDFDALKRSVYEETYGSYDEERRQYDATKEKKTEIEIVKSDADDDLYTLPDPVQPISRPDMPGRSPIINGDSLKEEEPENNFVPYHEEAKPEIKRAPIIIGSAVMADEPFVKEEKRSETPVTEKVKPAPIIRASRYEEDIAENKRKQSAVSEKVLNVNSVPTHSALKDNTESAAGAVAPEKNIDSTKSDADNNFGIASVPSNSGVQDKENAIVDSAADENIKSSGTIAVQENEGFTDKANSGQLFDAETSGYEKETSDLSAVSSADQNVIDDDSLSVDDEDLTNDEYAEIYGHPKFTDVSEEDADALSDNFEKTTTSFNISDEVEDASENVIHAGAQDNRNETKKKTEVEQPEAKEEKPKPKKPYKYTPPDMDLLTTESTIPKINPEVYAEKKALLEETLENLGIPAKVMGITVGPTVTRYELNMPTGMSVKKIENCEQDIRYGLACKGKIRIESPIPGKKAVGIEVPNDENALVALKDILDSKEFKSSSSPLTVALGKDIQGKVMVAKIDKMPHLLIAGTTGSGKSACLNSLIISLLYKSSPEDVKIILVDPKRVEFTAYSGLPHMMISDAITEAAQAINAFKWAREEMERRYKVLQANRVRNITEYNGLDDVKTRILEKMPYIVVIVDEFADLMIGSGTDKKRELENLISSIAGKARAAGIHLILATQRPSAEVITGTIKSNLPCRISFAVSNQTNSRIILDKVGAESLLGKGDMLYAPQENPDGIRIQGAYIETQEVINIVEQIKANNQSEFNDEFEKALVEQKEENEPSADVDGDNLSDAGYDKDLPDIVRMVIKTGQASGAMIQRRFSIGYMRAAKIVDQMEKFNFIGPHNGSKPREVYITKEKFKEFFGEEFDDD